MKVHYLNDSNDPDSSLLGSRCLVCNSPDGSSVHSRNRRPDHHGLQHQSHPRWEADAEGAFCRAAMCGPGTDSHDDEKDGCENSETAHRSILWKTIRRLCHGSSSKLQQYTRARSGPNVMSRNPPETNRFTGHSTTECPFKRQTCPLVDRADSPFKPSSGLSRANLYRASPQDSC
jgi:hypothetical protein